MRKSDSIRILKCKQKSSTFYLHLLRVYFIYLLLYKNKNPRPVSILSKGFGSLSLTRQKQTEHANMNEYTSPPSITPTPTNDLLKHNLAPHPEKCNSLQTIRQDWLSCWATEQDLVSYWIPYLPHLPALKSYFPSYFTLTAVRTNML